MKATRTAVVLLRQAIALLDDEVSYLPSETPKLGERKRLLNDITVDLADATGRLVEMDGEPF